MRDLTCPKCGYYWDTPNHELGCLAGHGEWFPEDEDEDSDDN